MNVIYFAMTTLVCVCMCVCVCVCVCVCCIQYMQQPNYSFNVFFQVIPLPSLPTLPSLPSNSTFHGIEFLFTLF